MQQTCYLPSSSGWFCPFQLIGVSVLYRFCRIFYTLLGPLWCAWWASCRMFRQFGILCYSAVGNDPISNHHIGTDVGRRNTCFGVWIFLSARLILLGLSLGSHLKLSSYWMSKEQWILLKRSSWSFGLLSTNGLQCIETLWQDYKDKGSQSCESL